MDSVCAGHRHIAFRSAVAAAQEQSENDIEALLQQRTQMDDLPSFDEQNALPPQLRSPRQLQTDLPPMTNDGSDASSLLGTDVCTPDEDAMFGEQLFQPGVVQTYGVGFNENYSIAPLEIELRCECGAPTRIRMSRSSMRRATYFLPNVGPVNVAGVRNKDLNDVISAAIRQVYRSNVNVYASLEEAQPVRVFVTGFVRAPGQYAGIATDSVTRISLAESRRNRCRARKLY